MLKLFKHKDQLDDPQGPPPKSNHITASPVADTGKFWMQQSCTLVENPGEKRAGNTKEEQDMFIVKSMIFACAWGMSEIIHNFFYSMP